MYMGCTVLVGLLSGDALEQQGSQSGYSAAADSVVHHEPRKPPRNGVFLPTELAADANGRAVPMLRDQTKYWLVGRNARRRGETSPIHGEENVFSPKQTGKEMRRSGHIGPMPGQLVGGPGHGAHHLGNANLELV